MSIHRHHGNKSGTGLVPFCFSKSMETLGLPVLTDHARFGVLEIGEEFYLPGQPIRYVKTGKFTGQIHPSANLQKYAQIDFELRWKVWRRIEP